MSDIYYKQKYLIYKQKYLNLKKIENKLMTGGGDKPELYLFKAEWCGHCTRFKPIWKDLQSNYNEIKYNEYDADIDKNIMKKLNIQGYPTIMIKHNNKMIQYSGDRDKSSIINFVKSYTK